MLRIKPYTLEFQPAIVCLQIPLGGVGKEFRGVVDLMSMKQMTWSGDYGEKCQIADLTDPTLLETATVARNQMVSS